MTRRFATVAALALGLVVLSGCAAGASSPAQPSASAPVFAIDQDFPDPDVVATGNGYTAFATGTFGVNLQSATSPDLRTWTVTGQDPLPNLPSWATAGRTWAPDVSEIAGRAVMYFAAEHTASGRQCIGVATSDEIAGVFAPASGKPLVCPVDAGGAIDPSTFVDADGTRYLLWKTDGNCCGLDTWIEIAPLSADGLSLTAAPKRLIKQTLAWEGNLVEAPVLVRHGDRYVLFYSANDYSGDKYAIGAATSDALMGPYVKQDAPVLSTQLSGGRWHGPGGQDVVTTSHGDVLVFHSWDDHGIYRGMNTAPITWSADGIGVALR